MGVIYQKSGRKAILATTQRTHNSEAAYLAQIRECYDMVGTCFQHGSEIHHKVFSA